MSDYEEIYKIINKTTNEEIIVPTTDMKLIFDYKPNQEYETIKLESIPLFTPEQSKMVLNKRLDFYKNQKVAKKRNLDISLNRTHDKPQRVKRKQSKRVNTGFFRLAFSRSKASVDSGFMWVYNKKNTAAKKQQEDYPLDLFSIAFGFTPKKGIVFRSKDLRYVYNKAIESGLAWKVVDQEAAQKTLDIQKQYYPDSDLDLLQQEVQGD